MLDHFPTLCMNSLMWMFVLPIYLCRCCVFVYIVKRLYYKKYFETFSAVGALWLGKSNSRIRGNYPLAQNGKLSPKFESKSHVLLWRSELESRFRGSWKSNQFLNPTNQKIVKVPFFTNCFFPRYDNFRIISTDNICLSRFKWMRLNDKRRKFRKLCCYTLKLKIVINFF